MATRNCLALTKKNAAPLQNGASIHADIRSIGVASPNDPKHVAQMILQLESRQTEIVQRLALLRKLQGRLTN